MKYDVVLTNSKGMKIKITVIGRNSRDCMRQIIDAQAKYGVDMIYLISKFEELQ